MVSTASEATKAIAGPLGASAGATRCGDCRRTAAACQTPPIRRWHWQATSRLRLQALRSGAERDRTANLCIAKAGGGSSKY